ncbi:hypothetical protein [Rhizobium sp. RHZ01]|uniref:hypothetical protein n=1 Tax=Rhizobium sp. RHZ01 TaxID=2769304 RepID=UPI00177D00CC|nr:hypothetical protein [Rhizobium sp. RHZ01]MBD9448904.1 hypothetical protein [Rhizobium sp. RHZ01]
MTLFNSPEFTLLARDTADTFQSVHRTWVAVRHGISWEVRFCRVLFGAFPPINLAPEKTVTTSSIRAYSGIQSLDDPRAAVEETLADPFVAVEAAVGHVFRGGTETNATFHRLYPPEYPDARRFPTLRLEAPSLSGFGTTEQMQLDLELLSHIEPYENMLDLFEDFSIPVQFASEGGKCITEVVLAPVSEIEPLSKIESGLLKVGIVAAPRAQISKITLGVKAFTRDGVRRFTVAGDQFTWKQEPHRLVGALDLPLANTPLALTSLRYGSEHIQKWWVRDQTQTFNRLLDVHIAIDPARSLVVDDLSGQRTDFEERVGLLFSLLGLRVLKYGQIPKLTDAPDILALSDRDHLYVVECTTGDINAKGKLQKLADRTKAIAHSLSASVSRPSSILPVVATSLSRQETAAHRLQAEVLGVALLCKEDLMNLVGQVEAPPSADRLFDFTRSLVPNSQP